MLSIAKKFNDHVNENSSYILSIFGSIIITSAIFQLQYSKLIDLSYGWIFLLLSIPPIFTGILIDNEKKVFHALFFSVIGSLTLITFMRTLPAFLGIISNQEDIFIFQQITETIPLIFLIFPVFIIGSVIGVVINEFLLKSPYSSKKSI
ncbi:MAG: hypothetical protein ACFFB5_12965 [Promethearchaeota archaeon]